MSASATLWPSAIGSRSSIELAPSPPTTFATSLAAVASSSSVATLSIGLMRKQRSMIRRPIHLADLMLDARAIDRVPNQFEADARPLRHVGDAVGVDRVRVLHREAERFF